MRVEDAMRLVMTIPEMRAFSAERRAAGGIALVPTMGALHEGHLALMRDAKQRAATVVVSIFVNPTQFGPNEDFERYPRDIEGDRARCASVGVDAIFAPDMETIYPEGHATKVVVSRVTEGLCGASRPVHFAGVATIVTKLFNIVEPDVAVFGEKDFQQLVTIRRLVADLDIPVTIVGYPTVRESDGLAMSSRNAYLSREDRSAAPGIYRALMRTRAMFRAGERSRARLAHTLREGLDTIPSTEIEYAEIREAATLSVVDNPVDPVALVAVRIGKPPRATRLIDNARLAASAPNSAT